MNKEDDNTRSHLGTKLNNKAETVLQITKAVEDLTQKEQEARTRAEQTAAERQQAETELAGKQSELEKVKGELKTEKFKSSAIMDGLSSAFGTSKVKRQQQEIKEP